MIYQRILRLLTIVAMVVAPLAAHAAVSVQSNTWNVIGLDSNNPAVGPNSFPVGARVCNTDASGTQSLVARFEWGDAVTTYLNLSAGTSSTVSLANLAAGSCADAYFNVDVTRVATAYDNSRPYSINVYAAADVSFSTPLGSTTPSGQTRQLYVEHLISQNRNAVLSLSVGGTAVPFGGTANVQVGQTVSIVLTGATATQGYNQLESFLGLPNSKFKVLSVSTTYSADTSPYVPAPNPQLYADACGWDPNPASANYLSCVGGDYKAGGTVVTTYQVQVLSGAGSTVPMNALLYDFSGSSFHYNADFSGSSITLNVQGPKFSKAFTPATSGSSSFLTFTITNPGASAITGVSFTDSLPSSPAQMTVASSSVSTSGCGSPTFAPASGATSISFSDGTIAANGTCTATVQVNVPATPTTGTYTNVSDTLVVGGVNTGLTATAKLVASAPSGGGDVCSTIATWDFSSGTLAYTTKASDVSTATLTASGGVSIRSPYPSGSLETYNWTSSVTPVATDYLQFLLDTSKYTSVKVAFDYQGPDSQSPVSLDVTQGATPTLVTTLNIPRIVSSSGTINLAASSGNATYRLYAYKAQNQGTNSTLRLDNVVFTGCRPASGADVRITKAFASTPVAVAGTSNLTFTLTNYSATSATGVKFIDPLPTGLEVANPPNYATTCSGTPTWAPTAGATELQFGQSTGATIAASASCTASVYVKATTSGPHDNVTGLVSSSTGPNTGTGGYATASLTALQAPSIEKSFGSSAILSGQTTTVTFTITNPNSADALTGVSFTDALPSGLVVAATPGVVNGCAGTVTATAGASSIAKSAGLLAAGASCAVTVNVTSSAAASYSNSVTVVDSVAGTGNTSTANLLVRTVTPAISLLKQIGPTAAGPWTESLAIPASGSTNVYFRFTVENTGDVAFSSVTVNDINSSLGLGDCAATLGSGLALYETKTCVSNALSVSGSGSNSATVTGTYAGGSLTSPTSIAYFIPGSLTIAKTADKTVFISAGEVVNYTYTVTNTGGSAVAGPVSVTDSNTVVTCPNVASIAAGAYVTCTSSYTITAADVIARSVTNSAFATVGSLTTPWTSKTVPGPASVAKTFGSVSIADGGTTTLVFTLTNSVTNPAQSGISLGDTLPSSLKFNSTTPAVTYGSGCSGTYGTAIYTSGTRALSGLTGIAMASGTASCTVTVAGLTNEATQTSGSCASSPAAFTNLASSVNATGAANGSTNQCLVVNALPTLAKAFSPASIPAGSTSTLTITLSNANPVIATLSSTLTDTLPANLVVAATPNVGGTCTGTKTATAGGSTVVYASGATIPASGSCTITVDVTSSTAAAYSNSIGVGALQTDLGTNPAAANATLTVTVPAALTITKSHTGNFSRGQAGATYTISVGNSGGTPTSGTITVTDTLPSDLTYVSGTGTGWSCGAAAQVVTCTSTAAIAGGGTANAITLTVNVAGNAAASITNNAQASGGGASNTPSAMDTTTIVWPVLAISKTHTGNFTQGQSGATYTVSVGNTGTAATSGTITVTDTLPTGLTYVSGTGTGWTCGAVGQVVTCTSATTISAGGTGSAITLTVNVAGNAAASITNTAGVSGGGASNTTSSSDATTVEIPAAVTLSKSGPASVLASGSLVYTLTLTNSGTQQTSTSLVVMDALPSGVSFGSAAVGSNVSSVTCTPAGTPQVLTCNVGLTAALVSGSTPTASFTITTTAPGTAGTVTNYATANPTGTSTAPNAPTTSGCTPSATTTCASAATTVNTPASFTLSKSGPATALAGSSIEYTLTLGNGGTSTSGTSVTVADQLPAGVVATAVAGVSGISAVNCGSLPSSSGGLLSCSVTLSSGLASGATASYKVTATVPGSAGSITNYAAVDSSGGAAPPTPGSGCAQPAVCASAATTVLVAPTVSKAFSPAIIAGGATSTLTITLGNANAGALTLSSALTDSLPSGVTVASSPAVSGTCTVASVTAGAGTSTITYASGASIPAGGCTIIVPVTATTAGTYTNTIAAGTLQTNGGNNASAATDTLEVRVADLVVEKNGPVLVSPSGTATYTVRVSNAGPSLAPGAIFTDPYSGSLTIASWSCGNEVGGAACPTASGTGAISETIATFPAGGALTYTVNVTAPATGSITNVARITPPANVNDPDLTNNEDSVVTGLGTPPSSTELTVVKYGPREATVGGTLTYTVIATNAGYGAGTNAVFSDSISSDLGSVTWTCTADGGAVCPHVSGTGNTINETVATFPSGSSLTYVVTGTVGGSATTGSSIVNVASITKDSVTKSSSVTTTVVATIAHSADLAIVKYGPATVAGGGSVTYHLLVSNTGPDAANGATVSDVVPSVLTSVTWTCAPAIGAATCSAASGTGNNVSLTLPTFPSGSVVRIDIAGTAPAGGSFANLAQVIPPSGTADPDPTNNISGPVIIQLAGTTLSGVVFNDNGAGSGTALDGLQNGSEAAVDPGHLNVVVLNSLGVVVEVAAVAHDDGTWIAIVPPAASYKAYVTTDSPTIGSTITTPTSLLPAGWVNTKENTGGVVVNGNGVVSNIDVTSSSATVNFGIVYEADLALVKTADTVSIAAGGALNYTLTVTNNGPGEVTNATVVDAAPANVTFGTWTCVVTNAGSGGSVTTACGAASGSGNISSTATMKSGAVITYTVPATVSPAASSGSVVNSATATVPTGIIDPTPANNTGSATITVTALTPALAVAKSHSGSFLAGSSGNAYTVTVSNSGSGATSGTVTLTDTAPAGMTVTAMSGSGWTCTSLPTCTRSDVLAAGGSYAPITVTVSVAAGASSPIVNSVTVSGGGSASAQYDDSTVITSTYTVTYAGNGNTSGSVPVDASRYAGGATVTVLGNTGGLVKAGYTFNDWSCDNAIGAKAGGGTFTMPAANVTCTAQWTALPTYTVTYAGNGNTGGSVPVDASSPYLSGATVTVLGNTGTLVKTGYTFNNWSCNNAIGAKAAGATFAMPAANVTCTAQWTPVTYTVTYNGNGNTGGTAPSNQTKTYGVDLTLASNSGSLVKTGYTFGGWATQPDGGGTTYAAGATYSTNADLTLYAKWVVDTFPVLTLSKTHTGNFTRGQSGASYRITVGNSGSANTSGTITVTDTLPAGLTYVSAAGTGWTCNAAPAATMTCTSSTVIATNSSGNPITLTVNVAANAAASITNTAGASGGGATNAPTASDLTTVLVPATLGITKTGFAALTAGLPSGYAVTVANLGGTEAAGATMQEAIPASFTLTALDDAGGAWSCSYATGAPVLLPVIGPMTLRCTTTTPIAAGAHAPVIGFTVLPAATAAGRTLNTFSTVDPSGGGSPALPPDSTGSCAPTACAYNAGAFVAGAAPKVSLSFKDETVPVGGVTTLTAIINNPSGVMLTAMGLRIPLPAGLDPAAVPNLSTTCGGTVTLSARTIVLSGGGLATGRNCQIVIDVTSGTAASYTAAVGTGAITDAQDLTNLVGASATVSFVATDLAIAKHFAQATGVTGAAVRLTLTITNNDPRPVTGLSFADSLPEVPAQMRVYATPDVTNGCSGTVVANPDSSSIILVGGSLAGHGSCDISLQVAGSVAGAYVNSIPAGGLSGTAGGVSLLNTVATQDTIVLNAASSISGTATREGAPQAGVTVTLYNGLGAVVGSVVTGTDGKYRFDGLPPSVVGNPATTYSAAFSSPPGYDGKAQANPSNGNPEVNGTAAGSTITNIVALPDQPTTEQNAQFLDPSGVVYDAVARTPIAGASVTLIGPDNNPVPNSLLDTVNGTVNGAATGSNGVYRLLLSLAAPSGAYQLQVVPPSGYKNPPSALIPPSTAPAGFSGGAIGTPGAPQVGQTTTYYLSFPKPTVDMTDNNIPLDPRSPVNLTITKSHSGSFVAGSTGNAYTVTVSNTGGSPTSDWVTVTDIAPTGMTVTAMSGTGWTCATLPTCVRSDALAAGSSYPPITVTVSVASGASGTLTNTVTASGGGSSAATATDPTTIDGLSGSISGYIWYDLNHNRVRDPNEPPKADWMVQLIFGGKIIKTTLTNSNGDYVFAGLATGKYSVRFTQGGTVPGGGAVNGDPGGGGGVPSGAELIDITVAPGGSVINQALPLDPSGVLYNSVARTALVGAVVRISGPAGFNPQLHLAGGIATQVTPAGGEYAFFLMPGAPAGTYTLTAEAGGFQFPSTNIASQAGGWPVAGGSIGSVGVPTGSQPTTYYLSGPLPTADIVNNNLPLDPIAPVNPTVPVPTLTEWGIATLSLLLLLAAGLDARRRRARSPTAD